MLKKILKFFQMILLLVNTGAPIRVIFLYINQRIFGVRAARQFKPQRDSFRESIKASDFSDDWFSNNIPAWLLTFERYGFHGLSQVRALEIGSFAGMSSMFILMNLENSTLTCVDPWEKYFEIPEEHAVSDAERKFDRNMQPFEGKFEKFRGTSFAYFNQNSVRNEFDFIYVDGSHHSDDVIVDAVKGFELLKIGGVMIFDDYLWQFYSRPKDNPAGAINAFLKLKEGCFRIIFVGYQIHIEKLRDRDV